MFLFLKQVSIHLKSMLSTERELLQMRGQTRQTGENVTWVRWQFIKNFDWLPCNQLCNYVTGLTHITYKFLATLSSHHLLTNSVTI